MNYSPLRLVGIVIIGLLFPAIAFGTFELIRLLLQFDPARDTDRELGPALRKTR